MDEKQRSIQQNKAEIWKPVVGYEGIYIVSNFGGVKRLPYRRRMYHHGKEIFYNRKEWILKQVNTGVGYLQVGLSKNGKSKCHHTHRLVAKAFIQNLKNKPQVNHKDGDKTNNKLENLEWCTPSENGLHAYRELGLTAWSKGIFGENAPTAKPVLQKTLDGTLIKRWGCASDAVRECGFDSGSISRCVNKKTKKHKGYIWEYAK